MHRTSTSAMPSLAQVDSDSPMDMRKLPLKTNHVTHHPPHIKSSSTHAKSSSQSGSPRTAQRKARYLHPDNPVRTTESTAVHPDVKHTGRSAEPKSSHLLPGRQAEPQTRHLHLLSHEGSKVKEDQGPLASNTTPALLTYSKMSTSALLLSLSNTIGGAKGGARRSREGGVASTVRGGSCEGRGVAMKGCDPRLTLPPHMRVRGLVFQANGKLQGRGTATSTSKGVGPLDLEAIGKGLGRMQYRNVIVMSGAGISTPCGIPDFR